MVPSAVTAAVSTAIRTSTAHAGTCPGSSGGGGGGKVIWTTSPLGLGVASAVQVVVFVLGSTPWQMSFADRSSTHW